VLRHAERMARRGPLPDGLSTAAAEARRVVEAAQLTPPSKVIDADAARPAPDGGDGSTPMDVTESGQAVVVMAGASVVPGDAPCLVCDGGGAFKGQVCGHCRLQELVDASGEVAEAGSSGERVSASAGGGKQVTFSEVDEVQIFDADAPPREVREDRAELEEEAQWLQSAGERLDELAGKPPRSRPPIAVEELEEA
jgi:hypothetical protein